MANQKNIQNFKNYQDEESLGRGRFAEVFRAVKRDLGREVALKVLLPEWNENAQVREQFITQARLIARLRHPQIVEVLDLGEENGRLYMALEYLPRGDLSRWLADLGGKSPSLLQVTALVADAAAALDFIHSQQANGLPLVHGDVKPGNLLLSEDASGNLRVKLCDLGLLTVLQQAATLSGSARFPQSSPLYISPEQANNQRVGRNAGVALIDHKQIQRVLLAVDGYVRRVKVTRRDDFYIQRTIEGHVRFLHFSQDDLFDVLADSRITFDGDGWKGN